MKCVLCCIDIIKNENKNKETIIKSKNITLKNKAKDLVSNIKLLGFINNFLLISKY